MADMKCAIFEQMIGRGLLVAVDGDGDVYLRVGDPGTFKVYMTPAQALQLATELFAVAAEAASPKAAQTDPATADPAPTASVCNVTSDELVF
jgi:hypothetical protein